MKHLHSKPAAFIFLSATSLLPALFGETVTLYKDHSEYDERSNCSFVIDDSQLEAVFSSAHRHSA